MPEKKARKYRPRRERVTARKVTRHPEYQRVRLQARAAEEQLIPLRKQVKALTDQNKKLMDRIGELENIINEPAEATDAG